MKSLAFDIMTKRCTKFYASLVYKYTPPINMDRLFTWIFQKLPTLKWEPFTILYDETYNGEKETIQIEFHPNRKVKQTQYNYG